MSKNENFASLENYPIYVHPKMVAMETIIMYPNSIFRYIAKEKRRFCLINFQLTLHANKRSLCCGVGKIENTMFPCMVPSAAIIGLH